MYGVRISYHWLGGVLGGRPADLSCYDPSGRVQYDEVANRDWFDDGIRSVLHLADDARIALMCTEKDPLECHRTLLVAASLSNRGVAVEHILVDGNLESHDRAMDRLMGIFKLSPNGDMFSSREEFVATAVERQAKKIAHVGQHVGATQATFGDESDAF